MFRARFPVERFRFVRGCLVPVPRVHTCVFPCGERARAVSGVRPRTLRRVPVRVTCGGSAGRRPKRGCPRCEANWDTQGISLDANFYNCAKYRLGAAETSAAKVYRLPSLGNMTLSMLRIPFLLFLISQALANETTGQDVSDTSTTTIATTFTSTSIPTTAKTLTTQLPTTTTLITTTHEATTPPPSSSFPTPSASSTSQESVEARAIAAGSSPSAPWCPREHVSYERLSGYKVADLLAGQQRTLSSSAAPTQPPPPSTAEECYLRCLDDDRCRGYSVNHVRQVCALTWFDVASRSDYLLPDPNWSFHRKICLPERPCLRHWSFERVPRFQLVGFEDKVVPQVVDQDGCLQLCASESGFVCRSTRYEASRQRCSLSRHDRRTAAESFRRTADDEDAGGAADVLYSENQCVAEPPRCNFRPLRGRSLSRGHVFVDEEATSHALCQEACVNHTEFVCRSFVYDQSRRLCLLSPDDSYSVQQQQGGAFAEDRAAKDDDSALLFEKGSCIDVEMRCEATAMTAIVQVTSSFRGRVYAVGHPHQCFSSSVTDTGHVALTVPLHGRQCGTKNLGNGTFLNSIVVQHHPYVLQSSDRRIDISCDYEEVERKLRGGKQVLEGDMQSLTQVITGLAPTPPVRLRVVNGSGDEVAGVDLGDPLYLKVDMEDESVFGIFGSSLTARSGEGSETILLLDDKGCPVEPAVFQGFERVAGSKSLMAPFQAFRFASDSTVKFQMTVSFCLDVCPPPKCPGGGSGGSGVDDQQHSTEGNRAGRRRRSASADTQALDLQTGDVVTDVTMETALFVVHNLTPSPQASSDVEAFGRDSKGVSQNRMPRDAVCLTRPVVYTLASLIGVVQAVILGSCCMLLFVNRKWRLTRKRLAAMHTSSSRASVSSRSELFLRT